MRKRKLVKGGNPKRAHEKQNMILLYHKVGDDSVQTGIYEYLGVDEDPIYQSISKLDKGQKVLLGSICVTLNIFGLYEVETEESHDSFATLENCYQSICEINGDYDVL